MKTSSLDLSAISSAVKLNTCSTCFYHRDTGGPMLSCTRYPPVIAYMKPIQVKQKIGPNEVIAESLQSTTMFPMPNHDWTCGEHRVKRLHS